LIARIDLDAYGLQRCHPEQWLGIRLAEDDCRSNDLAHELDVTSRDVQPNLAAVSQAIDPLTLGR